MTNVLNEATAGFDRAASVARETISDAAGQATQTVRRAAEGQRERGADALGCMARAVQAAAHELGSTSPVIGRYVDDAAGGLVRASQAMRDRSAPELLRDSAALARQQPLIAFAGAVLAGIVMSRFIKSSASSSAAAASDPAPAGEPAGANGGAHGSQNAGTGFGSPNFGGTGFGGMRAGNDGGV